MLSRILLAILNAKSKKKHIGYKVRHLALQMIDPINDLQRDSGDHLLPNAPTPQGLVGDTKFQQDGLIKAMALQSNYGRNRGMRL